PEPYPPAARARPFPRAARLPDRVLPEAIPLAKRAVNAAERPTVDGLLEEAARCRPPRPAVAWPASSSWVGRRARRSWRSGGGSDELPLGRVVGAPSHGARARRRQTGTV